jgi:hypothetical protein
MELLHAMNTWCRLLYGPMSGDNDNPWTVSYYGFGGLNIPATSLDVTALDLNGKATYAYTFYEVFPVEVFPLQFSSLNTNGILKLMVRFAFRTYNFTIPQS